MDWGFSLIGKSLCLGYPSERVAIEHFAFNLKGITELNKPMLSFPYRTAITQPTPHLPQLNRYSFQHLSCFLCRRFNLLHYLH